MHRENEPFSRRRLLVFGASALTLAGAACNRQPSSCDDVSGLTPDEIKVRKTLGYTDTSLDATKTCEQCQQWVAPQESGRCGTCKVMKGPVHPRGYCAVFVAK